MKDAEEAMRYSQILGMGGSKKTAKAVLATRLGMNLENDGFWKTVIQFFINIKDLDTIDAGPFIDFIYHTKFVKKEVHTDAGIVILDPPQPDFSMKGRTYDSVKRLVENWHKELAVARDNSYYQWRKSGFNDFLYMEETHNPEHPNRIWSVTELLTSADLAAEGRIMKHCVRSYASFCFSGKTTVWSIKREVNETCKRMVTIEVDLWHVLYFRPVERATANLIKNLLKLW
ncbi:MAG: hypothetical protein GY749_48075 [Desulfobacteraceae bacterium]|nr:hypothetical protein [Desulfobacteraceae bacterium]